MLGVLLVGKRRVPCRHHRPIRVIEVYTAYGESINQLGALLLLLFFNGVSMVSFVGCVAKVEWRHAYSENDQLVEHHLELECKEEKVKVVCGACVWGGKIYKINKVVE